MEKMIFADHSVDNEREQSSHVIRKTSLVQLHVFEMYTERFDWSRNVVCRRCVNRLYNDLDMTTNAAVYKAKMLEIESDLYSAH